MIDPYTINLDLSQGGTVPPPTLPDSAAVKKSNIKPLLILIGIAAFSYGAYYYYKKQKDEQK